MGVYTCCHSVELADANFGIFVERDNLIVDEFIRLHHHYKKDVLFYTNWAKNQNYAVVNIVKKLINEGGQKILILSVALQTLNDSVLDAINRKNLHTNKNQRTYMRSVKSIMFLCTLSSSWVYLKKQLTLISRTFTRYLKCLVIYISICTNLLD